MDNDQDELAENQPPESPVLPKKVLVSFKERKREVTFLSGKDGDIVPLLDAVGQVFADVLPSENPTEKLIVQVKNEEWDGEFTDAVGEIPDKSVVKVVRVGEFREGHGCETRLKGEVRPKIST